MTSSSTRLVALSLLLSTCVMAVGAGWETIRFGVGEQATAARVEREVRRRIDDRTRQVTGLAASVATERDLIAAAAASPDRLPALFTRLLDFARPASPAGPSVTIYVPAGPARTHRVLAWSDGPAEDLPQDRLAGPRALFLARGTVGLRLIAIEPVINAERRIGVASAEVILSPTLPAGADVPGYRMETPIGPVQLLPSWAGGGEPASGQRIVIADESGGTLLEIRFALADTAEYRRGFRVRYLAVATLPLLALPIVAAAWLLERRRSTPSRVAWLGWSLVVTGIVVAVTAAGMAIVRAVQPAGSIPMLIASMGALTCAAIWPVSAWWRRWSRKSPRRYPIQFVVEHAGAGVVVAAGIVALVILLQRGAAGANLERWQLPLLPTEGLLDLSALLVAETAIAWAVASLLSLLATRWHLHWRRTASVAALFLWSAPLAVIIYARAVASLDIPPIGAATATGAFLIFGLMGAPIRRYYRHASEAMRLLMLFAAIGLPAAAIYPLAAESSDRIARRLIADTYAPAAAEHTDQLVEEIARVEREINAIPHIEEYVAAGRPANGGIPSQLAFQVWSRTSLGRKRLTSEIELYGADRTIVSRFALNVPEFEGRFEPATPTWQGSGCAWEDWSEVVRFGAEERSMLHSQRGVCDQNGAIIGAIVVHLVPEYRDLPFVASGTPYFDVVAGGFEPQRARVPDLQLVVYGWSLSTIFTSGTVAWPIPEDVFTRLYQSRDPFWVTLPAEERIFHVHFVNNRAGIYALGYAAPTLFQQLTRLAELTIVAALLFLALVAAMATYAALVPRTRAPIRLLVHEIRTSFYRKLFLFFVLAAIGPVLLFALAFGAYMTGRFRADIESEAANVVTVARRVLQELAAAQPNPDPQPTPPTDDVMVWIRQVIDQDVNLFQGSQLIATSQRDLFDSGLLPTRTPAAVYRAIALNRLPVYVDEDRLGTFRYLVAAAPIDAPGHDTILTVPLATRQREIDTQVDELNRGVLVGAVVVVLFAAGLAASVAGRVSDPVARLTRATRLITAGRLDVRLVADTVDELGRLVDDFNSMARTLATNREELARSNQLKAWAEMARQVAHEIKNPLTPIQLAAEHLQRVHEDQRRPLGAVFDQCLTTILGQVRLLRRIASEFSTFAGQPTPRLTTVDVDELVRSVIDPYRHGAGRRIEFEIALPELPPVIADRTLAARALTNVVENAVQAMVSGGRLTVHGTLREGDVELTFTDTGVGLDKEAVQRAFEPYFSTKTAGSGLGLANARRNLELCGGTIRIASQPGQGATVTVTLPAAEAPPAAF